MMVVIFGIDNPGREQQYLAAMAARDLVRFSQGETVQELCTQLTNAVPVTYPEAEVLIREEWAEHKASCRDCGLLSCEGVIHEVIEEDAYGSSTTGLCDGCIDARSNGSVSQERFQKTLSAIDTWSGRIEDAPF